MSNFRALKTLCEKRENMYCAEISTFTVMSRGGYSGGGGGGLPGGQYPPPSPFGKGWGSGLGVPMSHVNFQKCQSSMSLSNLRKRPFPMSLYMLLRSHVVLIGPLLHVEFEKWQFSGPDLCGLDHDQAPILSEAILCIFPI